MDSESLLLSYGKLFRLLMNNVFELHTSQARVNDSGIWSFGFVEDVLSYVDSHFVYNHLAIERDGNLVVFGDVVLILGKDGVMGDGSRFYRNLQSNIEKNRNNYLHHLISYLYSYVYVRMNFEERKELDARFHLFRNRIKSHSQELIAYQSVLRLLYVEYGQYTSLLNFNKLLNYLMKTIRLDCGFSKLNEMICQDFNDLVSADIESENVRNLKKLYEDIGVSE